MRKAVPKKPNIKTTPVSPLSFRMPSALRARLRRFAKERNLAEAEALRLVVSERLDEIDHERELVAAERWQFRRAYATWQRYKRGEGRTVPWKDIQAIFAGALAKRPANQRTE